MRDKESKDSAGGLAKNILLGTPINSAAGPLRPRVNPENRKNPSHPQIVSDEWEGKPRGLFFQEASTVAGLVGNTGPRDLPTGGNMGQKKREGESGVGSRVPEQDGRNVALGATLVFEDAPKNAAKGFGPLEALLEDIFSAYVNRRESAATRNKIEVLLPRIVALDALFATLPGDVTEQKRRGELIRDVERIEGQLRSSYGMLRLQPSNKSHDGHLQENGELFGLLEDLQGKIFQYQTEQQTTISDKGFEQIGTAEGAVLNNFRSAQQAEYRHGDRSGCLKGTRSAVLDEIELWIRDLGRPPVYWLNGLAGTGKTTIAQTIAERMFADGRLGSSFFCSRDFDDRSNLKFIFPTLAVQLARRYARFRSIFVQLVQSDPEVVHESLYGQMKKLIVQPLMKSSISTVIVIDALDECKDEEPASAILSVLGQFVTEIPRVKFFVTGRPEPRIREGFQLPLLADETDVFVLHEVESSRVNSDIRLFFEHNFSELKSRRRGLEEWPTDEQLNLLCERTSGLFVYAMATVRFIGQKNNNPKRQLDRLLQSGSSVFEGKTKFKGNATLDLLYTSILQEAFGDDDPEDDPRVRSVLGAVVLAANPLSPSTIAVLLSLEPEDVFPLLSSVHSLLILQEDIDHPVRPFHKSFPDFIIDPERCASSRFHVNPLDQHLVLLVGCLELMNQRLGRNMCKLPDGVINSEVVDLKERVVLHIDQALQYACKSWYKHLAGTTPSHALNVTPILHQFLEEKFLFWLEVLSVLGAAREAVEALNAATKWLNVSPTLNLVQDCFRFVLAFFEVISISAPHIYHSALLLSPQLSVIRRLYGRYARPLARIIQGLQVSWDPVVATVYRDTYADVVTWSPCGRLVAVAWRGSRTIEVLDGVTLKPLNVFISPRYGSRNSWLSFSLDSRLLTQFGDGELISWDLQTGGSVGTISSGPGSFPSRGLSSTHSTDGKVLAVACRDLAETPAFAIVTYNLHSKTHIYSHPVSGGHLITPIWTHGESFRFATIKPGSITTWEVGFSSPPTPAEVGLLPIPGEVDRAEAYQFLPTLSRLAFATQGTIFIWDAKESKLLNLVRGDTAIAMSFSSDGRLFACANTAGELNVWRESSAGYAHHQKLVFASTIPRLGSLFSPNGESIIMPVDRSIRLWPTEDPLSSSRVRTRSTNRSGLILELSPDETLAAVSRMDNTVTIHDLESGRPGLVIDAGMEILHLGATGSTVGVVGEEKVVTWNLPARNGALDLKEILNSARTAALDLPRQPPDEPKENTLVSISPHLNYVATLTCIRGRPAELNVYDTSTGKRLTDTASNQATTLYFTEDGREVWCITNFSADGWKIIENIESGTTELKPLDSTTCPSRVPPWESSRGYKVTHDGWVISPTKKRPLWLPHNWRTHKALRTWAGRFLALDHDELPEIVVLEFFE